MPRKLKGDKDLAEDLTVEGFVVAGTPAAYEVLGPALFKSPYCVRCGAPITYVFATSKGPMGGDCLATLTGDPSTRRLARKIHDQILRYSDWYDVSGFEVSDTAVWANIRDRERFNEWTGLYGERQKCVASFDKHQKDMVVAIVAHEAEAIGKQFKVV